MEGWSKRCQVESRRERVCKAEVCRIRGFLSDRKGKKAFVE